MLGSLQKLGKALMLPVAVLPAAALLLRLGAGDVLDIPFVMQAGAAIFDNLALLFAIGVAVGIAFDGGGAAALAGAVGYLTLTKAVVTMSTTRTINWAFWRGILSGVGGRTALQHSTTNIKLLGLPGLFFGSGKRFVPIAASSGVSIALALVFGYIWPPIQQVIHGASWASGISSARASWRAFVFGHRLNRLLQPVGLQPRPQQSGGGFVVRLLHGRGGQGG
jgi:PTS system N-acetylglucosamine-specific IIC component